MSKSSTSPSQARLSDAVRWHQTNGLAFNLSVNITGFSNLDTEIDQAQAHLSDAIRQTGLCSTGITPSGLHVENPKILFLGIDRCLNHLWNDLEYPQCLKMVEAVLGVECSAFSRFSLLQGGLEGGRTRFFPIVAKRPAKHHISYQNRGKNDEPRSALVASNTRKPVSRLSEQMGLPSRQTSLQADLPGLGFDLQPNPSPGPKKPVGAGASPFGKPKMSLSSMHKERRSEPPVGKFYCADPQPIKFNSADNCYTMVHNIYGSTTPSHPKTKAWSAIDSLLEVNELKHYSDSI
ncbi:hypothetical protein C8R45DRAFT_935857 [Mycena sanguinolenta]|nr:hypothetical protein C8R45DRAFT_935857 [Mycena sanguinolenta]